MQNVNVMFSPIHSCTYSDSKPVNDFLFLFVPWYKSKGMHKCLIYSFGSCSSFCRRLSVCLSVITTPVNQ